MNYKIISFILGRVLRIEALLMVPSLICSLCYKERDIFYVFLASLILSFIAGTILSFKKPENRSMFAKEGFVIVAFSWILISIFGSLPFIFSGCITNFIDALFETVSGFTTTGASILADISILPKGILFWRSFTHWIGGMGVLVFLVALFPLFGGSNLYLVQAEATGPAVNKLVPKVKSTAKILYLIYIGITLLQITFMLIGNLWLPQKVSLFEALTLTFGTAGTGGFGVTNGGLADYSPYIQNVVTLFMIIFGIDFSVHYLILLGKFRAAFRSDEVKTYLGIIITSSLLIAFNCRHLFASLSESLHHSAFQVASIMTTTGFATKDFDLWPTFSKSILVALMFIGACAGSTGGGIKVSRILILLKSIFKEIKVMTQPGAIVKLKMNGRIIEHETVRSVNVYSVALFVIFSVSTLLIGLDSYGDFTTNFTAVAAAINNIGPGLSKVGPTMNFSGFSDFSTLVFIFNMLVGRLEVFPILLLFSPRTWRK